MAAVEPFADSALWVLDHHDALGLVMDLILADDAFFVALASRPLRDAMASRFPRQAGAKRYSTPDAAVVFSQARLELSYNLPGEPGWPVLSPHERDIQPAICSRVAKGGQLAVLVWVRHCWGLEWDWRTCWEAASHGHL